MAEKTRDTSPTMVPGTDVGETEPESTQARILRVARGVLGASVVGGVVLAVVGVIGLIAGVFAYQYFVVLDPGPHLDRDHIRSIISEESPVYYRDGTSRVGVFFEEEHRLFVPFEELPRAYVMSIIAAEDGRFWSHWGVDPKGILRAMRDNIAAGGVVAGGSTLTQQTAKNLYYRQDRSLKAKGVEFLNAARLEAHYDKTEILEFYVNQFHVSGNGRGLGIAARHFFDKEVDDLTVVESAFLAGLVKAPAYYDPFLGDEARRERAVERAHDRTRYVLGRLAEEGPENLVRPPQRGEDREKARLRLQEAEAIQAEARSLLDNGFELPFKRGSFRFDSSAVLDEVARRLSESLFDQVLGEASIDSAKTSGLQVVTTLDPNAQREATYALWHHLTEAGLWMEAIPSSAKDDAEGIRPQDFTLKGHRGPRFDPDYPPRPHEFRVARVAEHERDKNNRRIMRLDLGGHLCIVDRDAVVRVAVAYWRGLQKKSRARAPTKEVDAFISAFQENDIVLASVREIRDDVAYCDLEVRPELQGAVTVMQDGQVRALVGGNDNRNFNRTTALRQFGSTWKPLVYHAALKLGWQPDEALNNERNVFPFSTTFYYPRPDHDPAPRTSLAWAGVRSENLASIWLLYHLMDRLTEDQIAELAQSFDMARREDEDPKAYMKRVQEFGVLPTPARVQETLFLKSRQEVIANLDEFDHPEDRVALQSLLYGWGFSRERNRVSRESKATRGWKLRALDNDWQSLHGKLPGCRFQYEELAKALDKRKVPDRGVVKDITVLLEEDQILVNCGGAPEGFVAPDADFLDSLPTIQEIRAQERGDEVDEPSDTAAPRNDETEEAAAALSTVGEEEKPQRPGQIRKAVKKGPQLVEQQDLRIDDRMHLSTLEAVEAAMERNRLLWDEREDKDLYSSDVLYWHQDFRILLAMRYVTRLAEDYGVQTEIRQVLSMPLGASEITLEEAAMLYTGLVTGYAWEYTGRAGGQEVAEVPSSTLLIREIRDEDGRNIYQVTPKRTRVAEGAVADMMTDILRNVVLHGTGRRAKSSLLQGGFPIPVGGKTGTTNDFRNAAFIGYAPVTQREGFRADGGYIVAVYVGYDDNRPMANGSIKLAGASGALPAWIHTVQGLSDSKLLGESPTLAEVDEGEAWPLLVGTDMARMFVDPSTGLASEEGEMTEAMTLVRKSLVEQTLDVDVPDIARPARIAPSTENAEQESLSRQKELQAESDAKAEAEAAMLEASGGKVE